MTDGTRLAVALMTSGIIFALSMSSDFGKLRNIRRRSPGIRKLLRIRGGDNPTARAPDGKMLSPLDPRISTQYMPTNEETETPLHGSGNYTWNQGYDIPEVTAIEKDQMKWDFGIINIFIPVPPGTTGRDVVISWLSRRIAVAVNGATMMEGELWGQIRPDDSEWDVGYSKRFNNTVLHIMLPKATQQHWVYCLKRERKEKPNLAVTNRVWMEFQIGDTSAGRVVIGLFGNLAPKAVENFRALCTGEMGSSKRAKSLWYGRSQVHRVKEDLMICAGDIIDGSGEHSESIYGEGFQEDTHLWNGANTQKGLVSLVSMPSGDNRNIESYGSLFCVSLSNLQFLDRPHLVVGKVLEGLDVIKRISRTGPNPELRLTDSDPRISVQISDAGEEEFSINYMKTDVDDIEREHRRWIEQAQTGK